MLDKKFSAALEAAGQAPEGGGDAGGLGGLGGGDDAGGGVHWAPQVIEDAADHGLILGENGKLYDKKKGQKLPDHISPMPVMQREELA